MTFYGTKLDSRVRTRTEHESFILISPFTRRTRNGRIRTGLRFPKFSQVVAPKQINMIRRYKTLILFLVLATMSLRGMAAVDMWHCAHHQGDAMVAATAGHADHHGMHGGTGADHSGHDSSAPASPADESNSQLGAHCISSVVAPVQEISFSFALAGTSRIPFIELRFVGVVPAQPDRPPLVQTL